MKLNVVEIQLIFLRVVEMLLQRKFIDVNEIGPNKQANPKSSLLKKKKKKRKKKRRRLKKYDSEKSKQK
jgi:hypothetical protein